MSFVYVYKVLICPSLINLPFLFELPHHYLLLRLQPDIPSGMTTTNLVY